MAKRLNLKWQDETRFYNPVHERWGGETDFGCFWTNSDDRFDTYRVTWIPNTGELYAWSAKKGYALLGQTAPRHEIMVETALDGWDKACLARKGLGWVVRRLVSQLPHLNGYRIVLADKTLSEPLQTRQAACLRLRQEIGTWRNKKIHGAFGSAVRYGDRWELRQRCAGGYRATHVVTQVLAPWAFKMGDVR